MDLYERGFIEEGALEQLFCEKCTMFLADRFVEGTCPDCNYVGARGDQCDACGHLIDAATLIEPHCSVCQTTPVKKTSQHLFLLLGKLQQKVQEWKNDRSDKWSRNAERITQAWLDGGLERRCITRDLKWGVPVPLKGWENKVFYVWFDACPGYLSITANYTDQWEKWWKNPENVELFQFLGKDNVPFHAVLFPACQLGSEQNWTTVNRISATEYLNYEGGKFSKSNNTGIFGRDAIKEGISPHVWRYYLLASRPETDDSEFQWEDFVSKINTEFVANAGNFVFRLLNLLTKSPYDSKVPALTGDLTPEAKQFVQDVEARVTTYIDLMDHQQLREGLRAAMDVSSIANGFLTAAAPWSLGKTDPEAAASCMFLVAQSLSLLATLLAPFVPSFSEELSRQLNFPLQKLKGPAFSFDISAGHQIGENIATIIELVDGERIEEWWERYGSAHLNTISSIELKVGSIVDVADHPEGGEKYVIKVNVATKEPITVVARLQHLYAKEELLNTKVVVLVNLKHGNFAGVASQGMILGAEDAQKKYGLLRIEDPDNQCPVGARVAPAGWKCKPTPNISIKEFQKEKLYLKDDVVVWESIKRKPEFKKQPTKNPKGAGKNKAAPKQAKNAKPETVPQVLVANAPLIGKTFRIVADKEISSGKIK